MVTEGKDEEEEKENVKLNPISSHQDANFLVSLSSYLSHIRFINTFYISPLCPSALPYQKCPDSFNKNEHREP